MKGNQLFLEFEKWIFINDHVESAELLAINCLMLPSRADLMGISGMEEGTASLSLYIYKKRN